MNGQPDLQYWWVNQSKVVSRGLMGDYLWTARDKRGEATDAAQHMQRVQTGDLIFAFADGAVRGLGIALRTAMEAARPHELAAFSKSAGSSQGWYLPVRFFALALPLHPRAHVDVLKAVLPQNQSPLRSSGARNPAVYLSPVSNAMADVLRQLLAQQLEDVEAQIKAAAVSELANDWVETAIVRRTDLSPEEKHQLIGARRGLGVVSPQPREDRKRLPAHRPARPPTSARLPHQALERFRRSGENRRLQWPAAVTAYRASVRARLHLLFRSGRPAGLALPESCDPDLLEPADAA